MALALNAIVECFVETLRQRRTLPNQVYWQRKPTTIVVEEFGVRCCLSGRGYRGELVVTSNPFDTPRVLDVPDVQIFDTDHIINMVKADVRDRRPIRSRSRIYASHHVYEEMYQADHLGNANKFEKLASQSIQEGWSTTPDKFQSVFEEDYLPTIVFVDVGNLFVDHESPKRVHVTDYKDVPTAQLAVLLSGVSRIVCSLDKSLKKAELSPQSLPEVMDALEAVDLANSSLSGASAAVAGISIGVNELTKALAGWLRLPQWVVVFTTIVVVIVILQKPERRRSVIKAAAPIGGFLDTTIKKGRSAEKVLDLAVLPADRVGLGIEQAIAALLVQVPVGQGLLVREIMEQLPQIGFPVNSLKQTELRSILESAPCFVRVQRYRWQLGQVLGARLPSGME